MNRCALALATLVLSGSLAACGDDDGPTEPIASSPSSTPSAVPTTAAPSALASAPPDASAAPTPGAPSTAPPPAGPSPTADSGGAPPVAFPADTKDDLAEHSGGPLGVRAVRVARRNGYDRIVFELAGRQPGKPGWRVGYVEDPSQQGSGEPVRVRGAAALSVRISGTGYPMDTGVDEAPGKPALGRDLRRVADVVPIGVFEGEYEAFIGTSARAPFRVFRLDDPARVVVDVRD